MKMELAQAVLSSVLAMGRRESPIEEMFALALLYEPLRLDPRRPPMLMTRFEPVMSSFDETWAACERANIDPRLSTMSSGQIACFYELRIERMRVDFVFISPLARVAVELDGHDFHERTKEQAKRDKRRDRRLQVLGFRVLRFTGSEVYADPHRCVSEVLELIRSIHIEKAGGE